MKKIKTVINFMVAPLMVILINWTSTIDKLSNVWIGILIVISFGIYLYVILMNTKQEYKISNENNNMHYFKKALLFFSMVILTGILLTQISTWINVQLSSSWSQEKVFWYLTLVSIFLFIVHVSLRTYNAKSSILLPMMMIACVFLIGFYYFVTKDQRQYQQYIYFLFLSFYSIYLFYKIIKSFTKPYNDIDNKNKFEEKEHLIIFLSVCSDINRWNNIKANTLNDLYKELNNGSYNNWKMPVKGIAFHENKLKKITIIASKYLNDKNQGSWRQAQEFKLKILPFFPKNNSSFICIESENKEKKLYKGIDFGSFEEVKDALTIVLESNNHYNYKQTVIDFTGGQKPTTVAATLVATSYPVYCQYVDTHNPCDVFGYDFKYTDPTKIS